MTSERPPALPRFDGPVRIVLRPIGAPLTLGMAGLAIASLVESGVALGWTSTAQTAQAGLILIAVPFVLQIIACVFSYLARDGAAGSALGILHLCPARRSEPRRGDSSCGERPESLAWLLC